MPLPVQLGYHCTVDTGQDRIGGNRNKNKKKEREIGCSIPKKCRPSKCQSNLGHYEVTSNRPGVYKSVCPNQRVEEFLEENIQVCPQKCNDKKGPNGEEPPPTYYSEQTNDCQLCPRGYT